MADFNMLTALSLRSYTRQRRGHVHTYHQLVLPLRGVINIEVGNYCGKVTPGECVVIRAGELHHFTANQQARFVVADITQLPSNLAELNIQVFSLSAPLLSYLSYIETQLEFQVNPAVESTMFAHFNLLLAAQTPCRSIDNRIRMALEYITDHLADNLRIDELAKVACLSATQFKKLFSTQVGISVSKFITGQRMEKAKALLIHTDYPVQLIAEQVGYNDFSAFSRRFSRYYGLSPKQLCR